jgi:hypothetical protein
MEAKRWITFRLLVACTLRGGLYGLVGGTVSGLILLIYGVVYGAPIGCALGFGFGLLNGLAIRLIVPYGRGYISPQVYKDNVTICCMVISAIIDAAVIAIDQWYLHTFVLTCACLIGIPAILISAWCLAKFVADWYPRQIEIKPIAPVLPIGPDVWPPAPRMH